MFSRDYCTCCSYSVILVLLLLDADDSELDPDDLRITHQIVWLSGSRNQLHILSALSLMHMLMIWLLYRCMQIKSKAKREENHVVYVYVDRLNFTCGHSKTPSSEYKADLINMTRLVVNLQYI